MKNKNLLIGGAVVVGGLLFFYLRSKRSSDNETRSIGADSGSGSGSGAGTGTGMGSGTTTTTGSGSGAGTGTGTGAGSGTSTTTTTTTTGAGTSTSKLTKFEVDKRVLNSCGIMPPSFRRQKRNQWDDCKDKTKAELRGQGLISFNGLSEGGSRGLDFDGGIY